MRKKAYQKKAFESTGVSSDTSANIYMSMLMSHAWRELTANQQRLYLYCKAQYYGEKRKPTTDEYPQGNDQFFFMNQSKWCSLYGLYKENNRAAFYRDMEALIKNGFVTCIQSGKTTRTKSIYAFSSKWQTYCTSDPDIQANELIPSTLCKPQKDKKEWYGKL